MNRARNEWTRRRASHMDMVGRVTVSPMKKRLRRRGEEVRDLFVNVAPDVEERISALAHELNVPKWAVIEAAVRATTSETVVNAFQDELDKDDELELPVDVAA